MSLNELLSSLRDIAFHALPDSELYGCALAVKAFAELYRVSSQDQREELFKIVDTCFCGNLTEIEKRFSSRRDEVAKHFLEKLRELHKVKDVKFPHLDVYSILLLSESFDKVMQKHSDAAHISIYLGKRLVSLISFLEKSETEKALEDLLDYEYPFTDELLSSIRETIERYRSKRIDDRFDFLRQEFEKYDLNRNVLKLSEMWLREKIKISCEKILCYLISGRRNGITYILGSSRPIKIRQDSVKVSIFCNFWPLFLGFLWKIVLIHEVIHSVLNIGTSINKNSNKSIEEKGFIELEHALVNILTLREASTDSSLKPYLNIALGFVPYGQLTAMLWYNSLEKRWPGVLSEIPIALRKSKNENPRKRLMHALNICLEKIGVDAKLTEEEIPDLILFCPQRDFTQEKLQSKEDTRLRKAGAVRCVFKILLLHLNKPLPVNEIYKLIQDPRFKKAYKLYLYMPPEGYTEEEICQALKTLLNLAVVEMKENKYRLVYDHQAFIEGNL